MKKCFVFLMLITAGYAFGQTNKGNKPGTKTDVKPTTTTPPATTPAATQNGTEQAKQLNPLVSHFLMKYNVAVRFNDMAVAKDALYDLIVENPANDSLILSLAVMYYEAQQFAPAILTSQELLARNAKNTTAIEISAASYEGLNLFDKALQGYESLYMQTNTYPSLYKMAFLQYELKRFKECAATSDILLSKKEADELKVSFPTADNKSKEFPIKVAILNLKGMIARESGDAAGAKKYFEQALAVAPDFAQAKENLTKLK